MEYDDASNAFVSAEFPFLLKEIQDPMASIEELLSKKPCRIQPSSPSRRTSPTTSLSQPEGPNLSKNA